MNRQVRESYSVPDADLFRDYEYKDEFVETMVKNYSFLNAGACSHL